ncbi:hypothetical protein [Streptomyces sp. BE133]|uniref:hypothetical protein n=1 Tax=Streptomyces sp. BE133 TaxID=3002523 RepID=UPI002E76B007|nr:hypothetical protein [Streptomyces sp. BE133]MEE1812647.1 hypothetical protein [Streptomyces sp. BE133]
MNAPEINQCCTTGTCFMCRFWEEKVRWAVNSDQMPGIYGQAPVPVARVNGLHYIVKPMNTTTPREYLGFGGRLWTFRFNDGREVTSNDVMFQGDVPAHFADQLPDNAVIVPQAASRTKAPFSDFEGLL